MAKLDNVKVVNENTVEYNGFVYESITGDAQVTDLVKASDYELDVTEGAFYLITGIDSDGDIEFYDDANDGNIFIRSHHSVFRKSHAITNDKLSDAEGVVKIELPDGTKLEGTPSDLASVTRSMQALQAEQVDVSSKDNPSEEVEVEDISEPVPSRLQVGEYAKVVAECEGVYDKGDIVKIINTDSTSIPYRGERLIDKRRRWLYESDVVHATEAEVKAATKSKEEPLKVGDYARVVKASNDEYVGLIVELTKKWDFEERFDVTPIIKSDMASCYIKNMVKATDEEVQMAMREAKQALLKEGDFARIISNESNHRFEVGTVVKLQSHNQDIDAFTAYYLDESDFWGVYSKDLEPLTKEETEHITREAEEEKKAKAEREKWTAIGREVGEIKAGDIVRTTSHCGSVNPVGTIGVAREEGTVDSCSTVALNGDTGNWSEVELIVPVEQRFDKAE